MDYQNMTVAELRELARKWGVKVPKNAKKSSIIGLLQANEPIEVEAEVIENTLAVSSKKLEIDSNELVSKVAEITEAIGNLETVKKEMDATEETIASMSLEEVGICKKALSEAIKAADEKRLEFGRILRKPIELVNAKCKELTREAEELNGLYKAREKSAEEDRKIDKKNELREHYEAYAGLLLEVVPYEKMHDESWLNKTCSIETAKGELEEKVDKLARDWKSLQGMKLEFEREAETRLFDTFDLGDAIAWAGKLAEDKRKIEAMKAELAPEPVVPDAGQDTVPPEAYEPELVEYEAAPVTCEDDLYVELHPVYEQPAPAQPIPAAPIPAQPASAYTTAQQIEKDEVLADITALLSQFDLPKLKNLRDALKNASNASGEVSQRVMVIDAASQMQMQVIGKFCGLVGVTGTFKHGNLAQVVQRENERAAQAAREVFQYGA